MRLASGIRHAARTIDLDSVRVTGEPPIRVMVVHTLRDQRIPNPKKALHTLTVRDPCRGGVCKLALALRVGQAVGGVDARPQLMPHRDVRAGPERLCKLGAEWCDRLSSNAIDIDMHAQWQFTPHGVGLYAALDGQHEQIVAMHG